MDSILRVQSGNFVLFALHLLQIAKLRHDWSGGHRQEWRKRRGQNCQHIFQLSRGFKNQNEVHHLG